jgi:hypothetical protein
MRLKRKLSVRTAPSTDVRGDLHEYFRGARETLLWKLEGLGEYDIRRPMTPTGTNLLGLVKHQATTHISYFCKPFGRSHDLCLPWMTGDVESGSSLWAAGDESRAEIIDLYRRTWNVADRTITELPLDAVGRFPWWGRGTTLTLQRVLVHVTAEAQRHAGHADVIRELIDGSAGLLKGHANLHTSDPDQRSRHHDKVEAAARLASGR